MHKSVSKTRRQVKSEESKNTNHFNVTRFLVDQYKMKKLHSRRIARQERATVKRCGTSPERGDLE